jgi:AGZA family xanthine/uracil permease-like MFS transporter
MFRSVGKISFARIEESLPAFLTIILIPLTFSITQGILWGFISHVGLYLIAGRRREIHPVMYALALVSIGLLLLEHVRF